ncbi:hypothetical protein ACIHCV_33195 [Streptomyces sp. NPDC051956]
MSSIPGPARSPQSHTWCSPDACSVDPTIPLGAPAVGVVQRKDYV